MTPKVGPLQSVLLLLALKNHENPPHALRLLRPPEVSVRAALVVLYKYKPIRDDWKTAKARAHVFDVKEIGEQTYRTSSAIVHKALTALHRSGWIVRRTWEGGGDLSAEGVRVARALRAEWKRERAARVACSYIHNSP